MPAVPDHFAKVDHVFEKVRERVLASPALLARLRATPDRERFVAETLRVAEEMNLKATAADVENALRTALRECIEPWA